MSNQAIRVTSEQEVKEVLQSESFDAADLSQPPEVPPGTQLRKAEVVPRPLPEKDTTPQLGIPDILQPEKEVSPKAANISTETPSKDSAMRVDNCRSGPGDKIGARLADQTGTATVEAGIEVQNASKQVANEMLLTILLADNVGNSNRNGQSCRPGI